jgi:uncharacterized glyoxalase superfamily protein PhnB
MSSIVKQMLEPAMLPTPPDWPRFAACVVYRDAAAAIDWLVRAFGFEVRLRVEGEGGRIVHSELEYGGGVVMVAQEEDAGATPERAWKRVMASPVSLAGRTTQSQMFFVDDALAHCEQARAAGAVIYEEPAVHDYGEDFWADRSYGAMDPEGHLWWITQRLRTPAAPPPAFAKHG